MRYFAAVAAGILLFVGWGAVGAGEKTGNRTLVIIGYVFLGVGALMVLPVFFPAFGSRRQPPTDTK